VDIAVGGARLDEAIFVGSVAASFAAAEARNVTEDFGVYRRELIDRRHDFRRPRRRVSLKRQRRKFLLRMWRERNGGRLARLTGGHSGRWSRIELFSPATSQHDDGRYEDESGAAQRERQHPLGRFGGWRCGWRLF